MDLKPGKFRILHGYWGRRVVLRATALTFAASVLLWLQLIGISGPRLVNRRDCAGSVISNRFLKPIFDEFQLIQCEEDGNLTVAVVEELIEAQLLSYGAKSLCVGDGSSSSVMALRELGFSDASEAYKRSLFSFKIRNLVYEVDYEESSFDFVFSKELDIVSVPALIVEMERILKPDGIGAMLVDNGGSNPNGLIRSATPVSLLLKSSSVVHVAYVNNLTLVAFRKKIVKIDNVGYLGQFRLPGYCPSFTTNKPFIPLMEPLVKEKPSSSEDDIAYLPRFIDVSSKRHPVYVNIGAGESWFVPNYPINPESFDVYLVDHNTSVLLSHVIKPGITFVYHPGLAGTNITINATSEGDPALGDPDDGFDFLGWFKETVSFADFVVLRMNTGDVELKFLSDLFDSGAICFVDELFLNCSAMEGKGIVGEECLDVLKELRRSGVFVHQWWGE